MGATNKVSLVSKGLESALKPNPVLSEKLDVSKVIHGPLFQFV